LWTTAKTTPVIAAACVFETETQTALYVPSVQDAAGDGNVMAVVLDTTVTVTVPVVEPNEPARVLAATLRVHVPNGKLLTATLYVTLVPGLFAPVTEISADEISVPLAHACTELAFRSPPADVMFSFAVLVLFATEIALNVGAA